MKHSILLAQSFFFVWSSRFKHNKNIQLPFVYLDITNRCNSKCKTCAIQKERNTRVELSTSQILSIIPALKRLNTRLVSIGGGEPTMRNDLEICIKGFRDSGLSIHMNTNALNIDYSRAKKLVDAGLSVVYISCDHPDPEGYKAIRGVDGLNRVICAVEYFRSLPKPIPVGINITVSNLNQDKLEKMVQLCVGMGVQKIQFNLIHNHLRHQSLDKTNFKHLLPKPKDIHYIKSSLKKITQRLRNLKIVTNSDYFIDNLDKTFTRNENIPCVAGKLFAVIDPYGQVMPCYQYPNNLNIHHKPLDQLLGSQEFQSLLTRVKHCNVPCWDTGSAEPSICFHLPYLFAHLPEVCQQVKMHIS
ncbi:radical SAM domain protein [Candidatus Magnetomorum sp. HK-1]|nr:radical SAM domain protein [Candidatus Magnetomorum sp. HK-1]